VLESRDSLRASPRCGACVVEVPRARQPLSIPPTWTIQLPVEGGCPLLKDGTSRSALLISTHSRSSDASIKRAFGLRSRSDAKTA